MGEQFKPPETRPAKRTETPELTMERLKPVFQRSLDVFNNQELSLTEGFLTVSRERSDGTIETIPSLIVMEMTEDGPCLMGIDEEGEPTASATMLWKEIVDAI